MSGWPEERVGTCWTVSLYLDTCSTGAAFEQAGQRCVFMEQYSLANGKMPLNLLIPFPGGSLQIPLIGGA